MRSMTRGFTLMELLITLAIVGFLAALIIPVVQCRREQHAGAAANQAPQGEPSLKSSPYSAEGEFICEGDFDRAARECRDDEVCPTFIRFADGRTCVVHDAHPLNITVPRGSHIRITLHLTAVYRIEPLPAEKP